MFYRAVSTTTQAFKRSGGRLCAALLTSTALTFFAVPDVLAQIVIGDGESMAGVGLSDGDTLTIEEGGTASATVVAGVSVNDGTVTVNNAGLIRHSHDPVVGAGPAMVIAPGATLILTNSGLIDVDDVVGNGIAIDGAGGAATISSLINTASGVIRGDSAISLPGGTLANLSNAGVIEGVAGSAVVTSGVDGFANLNGARITGSDDGLHISGLLSNSTNDGLIRGFTDNGILVDVTGIDNFHNLSNGSIIGGIDDDGISVVGNVFNSSNAGFISAYNGIYVIGGDIEGFINFSSGLIRGEAYGVFVGSGNVVNLSNHGTIEASGTDVAGQTAVHAEANIINLVNTGTIDSTREDGGAGGSDFAIRAREQIMGITNSGKILASLDAGSYAIQEEGFFGGGGETVLTLLPGSVIQGNILLHGGGADEDTLVVGKGLNLATTFESQLPNVDADGALVAADAATGLVAVVDTSVLAAQDNALSQVTGAISNAIGKQSGREQRNGEQDWWLEGLGGFSQNTADGLADTNHFFGGAIAGTDIVLGGDTRFGIFGGMVVSAIETSVANGNRLNSNSYFGGGYSRFDADAFYANFGLTAGVVANSSTRTVANNLVLGGLETARADYNTYFVTPEVTIGTEVMSTEDYALEPSLRLRYGLLHSSGYQETGSVGHLTLRDHTTHILDARLQMAMPITSFGPEALFELRTGVDGRFIVGANNLNGSLLGQQLVGFNPGGAQMSVGGFVGADFSYAFSDVASVFAAAEVGLSSETSFNGNIEIGFKGRF